MCHRGFINCDFPARNSWITLLMPYFISYFEVWFGIKEQGIESRTYWICITHSFNPSWKTKDLKHKSFVWQSMKYHRKKDTKQALLSLHWWIIDSDKAVFLPAWYLSFKQRLQVKSYEQLIEKQQTVTSYAAMCKTSRFTIFNIFYKAACCLHQANSELKIYFNRLELKSEGYLCFIISVPLML